MGRRGGGGGGGSRAVKEFVLDVALGAAWCPGLGN